MRKFVCPYCGQGWVLPAVIKRDRTPIWLCNECDSMWHGSDQPTREAEDNLSCYLAERGLPESYAELEFLPVDDHAISHNPVLAALDAPGASGGTFEDVAVRLRGAGATSRDLAEALADAVDTSDPERVSRILATMFWFPSPEALPLLCTMLVSEVGWHLHEDVAELLGNMGDLRAVDALVQIVDAPPAYDFDGTLGEKVVDALSRFDDPRATAAIARAAQSPQRRVWQAAIGHALAHGPPALLLALGRRVAVEDPEASRADEVLDQLAALGTPEAGAVLALAAAGRDEDLARHAATLLR